MIEINGQHWYESKKKKKTYYPSVTTVLSVYPKGQGFYRYLANQPSWEESQANLHEASERGTKVHDASEELDKEKTLSIDNFNEGEWRRLISYYNFRQENPWKVIETETQMVNDKLGIGGTVDRVFDVGDDELMVLDLKTRKSSGIIETKKGTPGDYYTNALQAAVYAEMYELETGKEVEYTSVLELVLSTKKGWKLITFGRVQWKQHLEHFKHFHESWMIINGYKKGDQPQPDEKEELPETLSLKKDENKNNA